MRILFLIPFFLPYAASASGQFTFLSSLEHSTKIPEHVISFSMVCLLLIGIGGIYRLRLRKIERPEIPDKGVTLRNICDSFGLFVYQLCVSVIGEKEGPRFVPVMASIFIVILCSNLLGLVPGFLPPTEHMSTTFALGIFSFLFYNMIGVKVMGPIKYIKHFFGSGAGHLAIFIFVMEIISNLVRPLTLGMRLRGNMFGDHTLLSLVNEFFPFIIPIVPMVWGLFVCVLQSFVFTMLSILYVSLVIAHQEHEEHQEHHVIAKKS